MDIHITRVIDHLVYYFFVSRHLFSGQVFRGASVDTGISLVILKFDWNLLPGLVLSKVPSHYWNKKKCNSRCWYSRCCFQTLALSTAANHRHLCQEHEYNGQSVFKLVRIHFIPIKADVLFSVSSSTKYCMLANSLLPIKSLTQWSS